MLKATSNAVTREKQYQFSQLVQLGRALESPNLISNSNSITYENPTSAKDLLSAISLSIEKELWNELYETTSIALACNSAQKHVAFCKYIETLIKETYNFFSNSEKRVDTLRQFQSVLDHPILKIKNISEIRWLSWYEAVKSICISIEPLLDTFLEIATTNSFQRQQSIFDLYSKICNWKVLVFLHFLYDILGHLMELNKMFQRRYIMFSDIDPIINSTIQKIQHEYLDMEIQIPPAEDSFIGDHHILFNSEDEINLLEIMEFAAAINFICHENNESNGMIGYDEEELEKLINIYGIAKESNYPMPIIDADAIRDEWNNFKAIVLANYDKLSTDDFLPNILILISIFYSIPFSSIDCERGEYRYINSSISLKTFKTKRLENSTTVQFTKTSEFSPVQTIACHNYSTATEHVSVSANSPTVSSKINYISPEPLNINSQLVILPQPRYTPREAGKIHSGAFSEHLAVLRACLKIGEIERARHILSSLNKHCTDDAKKYLDIKLHNEFIEAYLEAKPPRVNEALQWFDQLNYHRLTPDLATFSILIRGYLRLDLDLLGYSMLNVLVKEIEECGYSFEQLIESNLLSDKETEKVLHLLRTDPESNTASIELLKKIENVIEKQNPVLNEELILDEPVPTKSFGVKIMKNALLAIKERELDLVKRQIKLEENALQAAMGRWKHENEQRNRKDKLAGLQKNVLKKSIWIWHEKLTPLIQEELERCKNKETLLTDKERASYGPFLQLLNAEKLSAITILELLRQHGVGGVIEGMKTTRAVLSIGKAVENEYNSEQLKKKQSRNNGFKKDLNVHELFSSGKLFNMAIRREAAKIETKDMESKWNPEWPITVRAKVGSILASMLLECANIPTTTINHETNEEISMEAPAFYHSYIQHRGKRIGVIKLNPQLIQYLSKEPVRDSVHPRMLPMLVHPRPWLTFNSGGYLTSPTYAMRAKDCPEQLAYLQKASEEGYLDRVFAGLDVLGSTCWVVNKKVYKIVLEVWNKGEALGKIPPAEIDLKVPDKPENYETEMYAKVKWFKECRAVSRKISNNHSERCTANYKVDIAGAFLNETMYFPHSLDFRGRAYPIPPLFNHLGNDLCRGLLLFKEPKPLGKNGLNWLKIQIANLVGYDKASFEDRIKFTNDHIEDVKDSAINPLNGRCWWKEAEDPWQCLAACFELHEALESSDPAKHLSQIPIHQDGTCNGLQHYAALGGDLEGAKQVNLYPSDKPFDIYSGVAARVNELIANDAKQDDELAKISCDKITRKVVKQTVMTSVYGVTFIGARLQIESRLKEIEDIPQEKVRELSLYITKLVFTCLGEMFHGARAIQDWLVECAKRISKSVPSEVVFSDQNLSEHRIEGKNFMENDLEKLQCSSGNGNEEMNNNIKEVNGNEENKHNNLTNKKRSIVIIPPSKPGLNQMTTVVWTTPLDLPIVQPYRKLGKKAVKTNLQTINIEDPGVPSPVNSIKQRAAFPPNFIHSLDATHMLMTALGCKEKNLEFASVHDSFWTHACDVEVMNEIIRDQFIKLHEQPIMENLRNEFIKRYKGYKVPIKVLREDFEQLKLQKMKETEKGSTTITDNGYEPILSLDELYKIVPNSQKNKDSKLREFANALNANDIIDLGNETAKSIIDITEFDNLTFPKLPAKGDFKLSSIMKSRYFFN
ncbi:16952_t:CDS:10 [Funneliformis geosporum]|uniref:DNA-directed RNA polymerase n=1 Tax=Funneliformis geosporum TaxID=1117311 RepID=A0A9W4SDY8_9GLOM|nr:16952_t:CDS:10 [Funneliformis geosporum]